MEVRFRERFRMLFEASPVAVWLEDFRAVAAFFEERQSEGVTDLRAWISAHRKEAMDLLAHVKVIDVNPEAVRQNGAQSKEELLANLPRLFTPESEGVWLEELAQLWEGKRMIDLETTAQRLDGKIGYMVMRVQVPVLAGRADWGSVIVTGTDITSRKEMEERLRSSMQEAQAASLAKGRFLANMSHEIRTPMNGIIGMADLLLDSPLHDDQRELAQTLRASCTALLGILNDILDFSKIEADKLVIENAPVVLRDSLRDALDVVITEATAKGLSLTARVRRDVPEEIAGDAMRLRQVLLNLLGNAVKFTREGRVEVEVSPDFSTNRICFQVRDTGIGMEKTALEKLFQPFQQADASTTRSFGGTGLGLAVCKELLTRMGGAIEATSTTGKGSLFTFYLPVSETAGPVSESTEFETIMPRIPTGPLLRLRHRGEPSTQPPPREKETDSTQTLRVLVAEDNLVNQKVILLGLKRLGVSPVLACDGVEAVEAARNAEFDLAIIDLQMPRMDGLEAARRIRGETSPRPPLLVALTANAFPEDRIRALESGFDEYFTKPISASDLLQVLERAATRKGW